MNITRNVLPVIIAALAAMLILTGLEHYTFHLFPLPAGTDMYDEESAQKAIKSLPVQAFYMQLANYAVSSFLGGVLATLLAKRERRWPAITVGIVLTLGGIINSLTLHEPTWFFVASLFTYLPFTLLGYFITRKNKNNENVP